MKSRLNQDVYTGFFLLIVASFFIYLSMDLILEARLFPLIFLILLVAFSILLIIKGLRQKEFKPIDDDEEKISVSLLKKPIVIYIGILIYCLLIPLIGFFPSTIIFMITFIYINKYKNHKVALLTTLITMLSVYFVFVYQLNVNLPSGILFGN